MAFCVSCGTQAPDGVQFCPTCGKAMGAAPQAPYPPQPNAAPQQSGPQPQYGQPAPGYYADPATADAQQNKTMGILAYVFLIPLITGDYKKSPFVKFHTNQGIILWIFGVAYGIINAILTAIFSAILVASWRGLGVYGVITTILSLLWIVPGILLILGIVNAVNGKMKELPVIGKFQILK